MLSGYGLGPGVTDSKRFNFCASSASTSFAEKNLATCPVRRTADFVCADFDAWSPAGCAGASVRAWSASPVLGLATLHMQGNRFCENAKRAHKSNNVSFTVDFREGAYFQRCHDPDCRGFRGCFRALPDALLAEAAAFLRLADADVRAETETEGKRNETRRKLVAAPARLGGRRRRVPSRRGGRGGRGGPGETARGGLDASAVRRRRGRRGVLEPSRRAGGVRRFLARRRRKPRTRSASLGRASYVDVLVASYELVRSRLTRAKAFASQAPVFQLAMGTGCSRRSCISLQRALQSLQESFRLPCGRVAGSCISACHAGRVTVRAGAFRLLCGQGLQRRYRSFLS